jgi:hypothetical protein
MNQFIFQLVFIFVGLWSALPFMMISEQTDIQSLTMEQWTGEAGELVLFENGNFYFNWSF